MPLRVLLVRDLVSGGMEPSCAVAVAVGEVVVVVGVVDGVVVGAGVVVVSVRVKVEAAMVGESLATVGEFADALLAAPVSL